MENINSKGMEYFNNFFLDFKQILSKIYIDPESNISHAGRKIPEL